MPPYIFSSHTVSPFFNIAIQKIIIPVDRLVKKRKRFCFVVGIGIINAFIVIRFRMDTHESALIRESHRARTRLLPDSASFNASI